MKKLYVTFLFLILFSSAKAQLPTVGDCLGAIPICSTYYDEPDPYIWSGTGNYPNEINRTKECMIHELNGMWYTFTSLNSGMLRFIITPHDSLTDYDWNVFDITYGTCADLKDKPEEYLISSNTFGVFNATPEQALTGANTSISGGSGNCNGPGDTNGPPWNDDIPVYRNHIYLIYISNWSGSEFGYSIDFTESTADIWDKKPPELNNLSVNPICNTNELEILFSENVLCDKISSESFILTDSDNNSINVSAVRSVTCENGGTYSREFKLELDGNLAPDNYRLIYNDTICDICGNETLNDTLNFEVDSLEIKKLLKNDILCAGKQNGSIEIIENERSGRHSYTIDGINFTDDKNEFSNLSAGTYYVNIKNQYGCFAQTDTLEIIEPDTLKAHIIKQDVRPCNSSNNGEITVSASGGTAPYRYAFETPDNFSLNSTYNNLPSGEYTVFIRDVNACLVEETVSIDAPEVLKACLKEIKHIACKGDSTGLLEIECLTDSQSILWSTGDTTYRIENLPAGTYKAVVSNPYGCSLSVSHSITEPEKLLLTTQNTDVLCFGDSTAFAEAEVSGGVGEYVYEWSNGQSTSEIENIPAGVYSIKVTDANLCEASDTFTVVQSPELILDLTAQDAYSPARDNGKIYINIYGGTPFYETLIEAENIRPPYHLLMLYSDLYTITVTDANGCTFSDTITVGWQVPESILEVPNVFTPNSDGINDVFLLKAYGLKSFHATIINRWGRKVFQWTNPQAGWDGTINNSAQAAEGVYYYLIKAIGMDNRQYLKKGAFYLVK